MIFSRVWQWITGAVALIAFMISVYVRGRKDASDAMKKRQAEDSNRRLRDAIEADSRGRERIARGELLSDDGHRRD